MRASLRGLRRLAAVVFLLGAMSCSSEPKPAAGCRVAIDGPTGEVGFSTEVDVRAVEICDGHATTRSIRWSTGATGPVLHLRTPSAEQRLVLSDRAGVLPVSAEQAFLRVTAASDAASSELELMLAHRHSGLPSIPVGVGIYVYGGPHGSVQRFEAEHPGRFPVRDEATGFETHLLAGRPDAVPLDCGRSECHSEQAAAHASTRHASVLERALQTPPRGQDARCQRCHAVASEKGIPGGFLEVAEQIGFAPFPSRAMTWSELPRDLRRLGNVGCLACHGSGRIPEPAERALEYGAGVCAVCHDAPPRYGVVRDWRASRMSRLRPEALRPACAACHTAQGFVGRLRHRDVAVDLKTAEPVTCAACHDPHGPGSANARLVRVSGESKGPNALCASCHTADVEETDETRFARRLAPMAPQSLLAPSNCIDCHRPHVFRAALLTDEKEAQARAFVRELADAKSKLESALPRRLGCNRRAGVARQFAVIGDRIALVDEAGLPLGDCNGDGELEGEDPFVEGALADRFYRRAYELFVVERDKSRGLHDPKGAAQRIRAAVLGL